MPATMNRDRYGVRNVERRTRLRTDAGERAESTKENHQVKSTDTYYMCGAALVALGALPASAFSYDRLRCAARAKRPETHRQALIGRQFIQG